MLQITHKRSDLQKGRTVTVLLQRGFSLNPTVFTTALDAQETGDAEAAWCIFVCQNAITIKGKSQLVEVTKF